MIFPLGLGTKLLNLPIATIAIAVITFGLFFVDQDRDLLQTKTMEIHDSSNIRPFSKQIFVEYCLSQKGTKQLCQKYSELIEFQYMGKAFSNYLETSAQTQLQNAALSKPPKKMSLEKKKFYSIVQAHHELSDPDTKLKLKYRDIFDEYESAVTGNQKILKKLPSYSTYTRFYDLFESELAEMHKSGNWYSSLNSNPKVLLFAQFRHGGWLHLIGNLVAFVPFAIYVEQRVGLLVFLLTYFLGGSFSLFSFINIFSAPGTVIVGASGNISVVMGLFFILFLKKKMKVIAISVLAKQIFLPVIYSFPLLFIISDIVGGSQGSGGLFSGNVAHSAHLSGLIFGVGIAWLIQKYQPLPDGFAFPGEVALFHSFREAPHLEQISRAAKLLEINPENNSVRGNCLYGILRLSRKNSQNGSSGIGPEESVFLKSHLQNFIGMSIDNRRIADVFNVLMLAPHGFPLRTFLSDMGQNSILQLATFCLNKGHHPLALNILDLYIHRFPDSRKRGGIIHSIVSLLDVMQNSEKGAIFLRKQGDSHHQFIMNHVTHLTVSYQSQPMQQASGMPTHQGELPLLATCTLSIPESAIVIRTIADVKIYHNDHEDLAVLAPAPMKDRFLAFTVDAVLQSALISIFSLPLSPIIQKTIIQNTTVMEFFFQLVPILAGVIVYSVIPLSKTGQTIGKRAFGIRVIPANPDEPITGPQAAAREIFAKTFSILFFGAGMIMAFFTKDKISFHDMATKTKVVRYKQ